MLGVVPQALAVMSSDEEAVHSYRKDNIPPSGPLQRTATLVHCRDMPFHPNSPDLWCCTSIARCGGCETAFGAKMTDGLLSPNHNQNCDDGADMSLTPRVGFRADALRKIGVEAEGRRTKEVFQDLCNRIAELQDSLVDSPPVKQSNDSEECSEENLSGAHRVRGRRKGRGVGRNGVADGTTSLSPEPSRHNDGEYGDDCRTPDHILRRRHPSFSGEDSTPDGARTPRFSFTAAERAVPGLVVDGKATRDVYEELCDTLQALQEKQRRQQASRREKAAMADKPRPVEYSRSRGTASEGYSSCDEPFETPKSPMSRSNSGDEAKLPRSRSRVDSRDSDDDFVSIGARVVEASEAGQDGVFSLYEERERNSIPMSHSMDSLSLSTDEQRNSSGALPLPKARSGATTPHHNGAKTPRPRSRYSDLGKDRENEEVPLVSQSMDGALTARSGISTRSKPRPRSAVSRPDWDDNDCPDVPATTAGTPVLSDAEDDQDEDAPRLAPRPRSAAKTPRPKSARKRQDDDEISGAPKSLSGRIASDLNLSLCIPKTEKEVAPISGSMSERSPTADDDTVSPLTRRSTHRSSREFESVEVRRGKMDGQVVNGRDEICEAERVLSADQPSPALSSSPVLSGAARSSPEAALYDDDEARGDFHSQQDAVGVAVAVAVAVAEEENDSPARSSSDEEDKETRKSFAVEVAVRECGDSAEDEPAKLSEDDTVEAAHAEDGPAPKPAPVAESEGSEGAGSGEDHDGEDAKAIDDSDAGVSVAVGGGFSADDAVSVPVAVGVAVAVGGEKEPSGVEVFVSEDANDDSVTVARMQRRRRQHSPEPVPVAPPVGRGNARGKTRGKAGRAPAPAPAPARVKMECRVLLLGLDNAGKTTMTRMIAEESIDDIAPTTAYTNKTITMNNVRMNLWDLAGQDAKRKYWPDYYEGTDAIVYVIDSADHRRTDEAVDHLHAALDEESLSGLPLLILSNKQDLMNAQPVDELSDMLMLYSLRGREWNMVGCSAKTGDGLLEAFEWLVDTLLASNDREGHRDNVDDGWT